MEGKKETTNCRQCTRNVLSMVEDIKKEKEKKEKGQFEICQEASLEKR